MRLAMWAVLVCVVGLGDATFGAEVMFPDAGLEAAVRDALSQPTGPIDDSDVATLTFLDAGNRNISDLTGLEAATSLETLFIPNNDIADLSPVSMLPALRSIRADNNLILDLTPLASLTSLETLALNENPVSDLSPLASHPALWQLGIPNTAVTDFTPLATMPALVELFIGNSALTAIPTVISGLGLSRLDIRESPVGDLSPLASVTSLTILDLTGAAASDFSPLANLTALTQLTVRSTATTNIADLSPLAGLTQLISLQLDTFAATDLTPLQNMTALTNLELNDNPSLTNINVVTNFTNLFQLQLIDLGVTDLQPVVDNAGIAAGDTLTLINLPLTQDTICNDIPVLDARVNLLQLIGINSCAPGAIVVNIPDPALEAAIRLVLDHPVGDIFDFHMEQLTSLSALGVADLTGLEYAVNLDFLGLSDGSISDLTPISALPNIRSIHLINNNVSSFASLAGVAATLESLLLWENPLTTLNGLQNLTNLTTFSAPDSNIADVSALSGQTMPNLASLHLDRNPLSDISPLASLTGLDSLGLGDTLVRDISALVANANVGAGDFLNVHNAPLNQDSICNGVPALRARGVNLFENADCLATDIGCPVRPKADLGGEAAYASASFNWKNTDVDGDGLIDRWQVLLAATILCNENHPLYADTRAAYEHNYLQLMAETDTIAPMSGLVAVRHYLCTILLTSQSLQDVVVSVAGLDNNYQVVTLPGAKAANEPYSGSGDIDGDGVTNAQEAANVLGNGGDFEFFLFAVQTPGVFGTENLPAASALTLGFLAGVLSLVGVVWMLRRSR